MFTPSGQGRPSISNLGGTPLRGHFFLKKKGHFLRIERAFLCLLQNLWKHLPPVPPSSVPMSLLVVALIKFSLRGRAAGMGITFRILTPGQRVIFLSPAPL